MPSDIRKFFSPPQEKEAASSESKFCITFRHLISQLFCFYSAITPLVSSPEDIVKPAGPIKRKLDLNSSDEFESNNNKHLKTHQNNGVEIAEKQNGSDVAAAVDGEKQFNGTSQELQMDAAEKERRFNNFRRLYPEMDSLLAQQLLTRNKWDVSKANKAAKNTSSNRIYESIEEYEKKQKSSLLKEKAELEQNIKHSHRSTSHHSSSSSTSKHRSPHKHSSSSHKSSSTSTKSSSSSHSPSKSSSHKSSHHHHKRRSDEKDNHHRRSGEKEKDREKRKSDEHHHKSSSKPKNDKKNKHNEDSDEDQDRHNTAVYDSDADSDDGTNFVMTKDRQTVFDFFNQATHTELMSVKTCSAKKADIIIELRPFESWSGLVTKINEHKSLNYDLLNNGHEWLKRREKVTKLLRKCNKIIVSLQRAIEGCKDKQIEQPRLLCTDLKLADYQLVGLNWLIMMHQEGFNGILADEMGLGKTIQIISFLAYLKEKDLSNGPHLIIVPSSTLDNWDNEMAKWCPTLNVVKYYGSLDDRKSLRISFSRGGLDGVDVVLTTYTTVASQPEERKMFRTIKIDYVIFDEAHMLKNMTTIRYEHLSKINANRRILLTGTPLQNNLLELMSLLCFIMPKLFSSSTEDFKTLFQKAYKPSKGAEEEGGTKSETATFFEQSQIEKAKQVMKPFVLRRLKKDVLKCLPPKSTTVIRVKMAEDQRRNYNNLVEYYSNEDNVVKSSSENNGMSIMMDMRKLTNHPLLMRYFFTDKKCNEISQRLATDMIYKKTNAEYILEELVTMSDYQIYQLAQKYPVRQNDFFDCFNKILQN